jgi:hypothetical protein
MVIDGPLRKFTTYLKKWSKRGQFSQISYIWKVYGIGSSQQNQFKEKNCIKLG